MSTHRRPYENVNADILTDPGVHLSTIMIDRTRTYIRVTDTGSQIRLLGPPTRIGQRVIVFKGTTAGGSVTVSIADGSDISGTTFGSVLMLTVGQFAVFQSSRLLGVLNWRFMGGENTGLF